MRLERLALRPVRAAARSSVLNEEAERVIDDVLAGPLPEAVARSLIEQRVIDRVASEVLDSAAPGGELADQIERLVDQVLRSPALERWVESGDAGRLTEPMVERIVQSPVFRRAMLEVLSSPEIRRALTAQTAGFGAELAAAVGTRTARVDDAVQGRLRRLLRRPPAEAGVARRRFGGLGTRAVALVADVILAQLLFLVVAASLAIVGTLVGASRKGTFAWSATGAAWFIVAAIYFTWFWSSVGQTPGMRMMRLRVVTAKGTPPSIVRSFVRFVGLLLAIAPAFLGILPVLVDSRRRALQDFIAGTVVLQEPGGEADEPDMPGLEPSGDANAPGIDAAPPPRSAAVLESSWSKVGGVRMHAVVGGSGPPALLVHGYGVSGDYMLPLARALAHSFTVFVPDLPGQGKSGEPIGTWGMREMAQSLGAWLDAAGISEPIVVANSMGCQIVTELAVERPNALGPMVLVGPTIDPARRHARHQLFGMLRDTVHEPLALVGLAARNAAADDFRSLLRAARATLSDRIEERLPLIERSTIVVCGENDGFVSSEWAERAAALLPRGRLVLVAGEPHAVNFTRPRLVADIVGALFVEERDHAPSELLGRLEHRNVPAREPNDAAPRQEPLPVLR